MLSSVTQKLSLSLFSTRVRSYASGKSKAYIDVTDATIEQEVIKMSHITPVILECWAEWCRPCKALAPVLESAVSATNGEVILAKMSVDENRSIAVQAIPAVFGFSKGVVVSQFVGGQPSSTVSEFVKNLITEHNKTDKL